MPTEVWFRNPEFYIRECVEVHATNLVWDRGLLIKKSIDPFKWANLYFPTALDYRMLLVGEQGAAELTRHHDFEHPRAVYPAWEYGADSPAILEECLAKPWGEDRDICDDDSVPPDQRPVFGQEHRVVIIRPPVGGSGMGRKFFRFLAELQADYPDAIVHVHGLYSYRIAFGMGFGAADTDARILASKGKVQLPNGKEVTYEQAAKTPQWVTVCGFNPVDLKVPRNRCMFNIKSAQWAGAHWNDNLKFKSRGKVKVDASSPVTPPIPTTIAVTSRPTRGTVGDKFLCDLCSLQNTCKYFRVGGVCSIPETEPARLSRFFKTRDADQIIDGLGTLMQTQANRLERGMENELEDGELSPEVTRIIKNLFDDGVKLAKLLRPALNGGPKVGVFVGGGSNVAVGSGENANALVAALVGELEARGVPRDQITPDMLSRVLGGPAELEPAVIDAHVVDS